jgi:hypothetical protein
VLVNLLVDILYAVLDPRVILNPGERFLEDHAAWGHQW